MGLAATVATRLPVRSTATNTVASTGRLAPVAVLEDGEAVDAVAREERDDAVAGQRDVVVEAEHPEGLGELGGERRKGGRHALAVVAIEVPPAAAVADEVQVAVGRPGRLDDRLAVAPGHDGRGAGAAPRVQPIEVEFGAVPRHAGVIPAHVGETVAAGADPRRGEEVVAVGHDPRRPRPVGRQGDDVVDHAVPLVALAHAHEEPTVGAQVAVRVAPGARSRGSGRDGPRRAPARRGCARRPSCRAAAGPEVLPVQPLVGEVAEDHALAAGLVEEGAVHAAAVLVHQRAGVDAGRRDVCDGPVRVAPDDHVPAVLQGAHLDPVDGLADGLRPGEADPALSDPARIDRRSP